MLGLTGNNVHHDEIRDLLKKATVQANDKDYDTAIASLSRAYELMATCSTEWPIKTYFRLARYHHLAGRYEEARAWLQSLYDNVDKAADARELLYKHWGWMQARDQFAKISQKLRFNRKNTIADEIDLLNTRQRKIEKKADKIRARQTMNNDIYIQYIEGCIGKSSDDCETEVLTGGEIVEALWPLNKRFQASVYRLVELPYDAGFEQEANDAIVSYVFNGDNWSSVSLQAWRVLFERHRQAIIFFQLQENEPFVPIPQGLSPRHYLGAVLLFLFPQWKLPFPTSSKADIEAWSNTVGLPNRQQ